MVVSNQAHSEEVMARPVPEMDPARRMPYLCDVRDLSSAEFTIVEVNGREIGLIRVGDDVHAVRNRCPHMGAKICHGQVGETLTTGSLIGDYDVDERGLVVRCPWHKWEFLLSNGESLLSGFLSDPLKKYDVTIVDGSVYLGSGG